MSVMVKKGDVRSHPSSCLRCKKNKNIWQESSSDVRWKGGDEKRRFFCFVKVCGFGGSRRRDVVPWNPEGGGSSPRHVQVFEIHLIQEVRRRRRRRMKR